VNWPEREGECPRCVEAAALVLGALGAEEPGYRAHLAACSICQAEVAELRRVMDVVPSTAPPATASGDLRERVMAIVRAEAELLKAAGPDADLAPRRRRGWRPLASSIVAAGAMAAAALIAVLLINPFGHSVRVIPARIGSGSPGAQAVLREVDDRGELVLSNMPQAPAGRTYEVWVRKAMQPPRPTDALFTVNSRGSGSVDVPGSLRAVREVLVSAEPLGGSSRLTGPVLIRVRISS
jgi:hypothetical protein